jgi:hypothetical protein
MKRHYALILIFLTPLLASCEQLGMENPAVEQARAEAEGKAIGSGCRQTGRALEDCYQLNRRAPKAAIFAGWREMDAYMRENKIEEIKPDAPPKATAEAARPVEAAAEGEKAAEKKEALKDPGTGAKTAAEAKPAEPQPARKARSPLSR